MSNKPTEWDFYDHIAHFLFEMICLASQIDQPEDTAWDIQHNMVWSRIFSFASHSSVLENIQLKLKQLVLDEINHLETFPNFKSAAILGYCLNVMGFNPNQQSTNYSNHYDLHIQVLDWAKNNYLTLRSAHPPVAEACLIGSLGYDHRECRLIHRYQRGLSLKDTSQFLALTKKPPSEDGWEEMQ